MNTSSQSAGKTLVDIGWLVGAWESEGWFSLVRNQAKHSGTQYTPNIGIINTDKIFIDKVIRLLKENDIVFYVYKPRISGIGKKEKTSIVIQGIKRTERFLDFMESYLESKKEHAGLIREFINYRKPLAPKQKYSDIEYNIWVKLRILNGRATKEILREHTLNLS